MGAGGALADPATLLADSAGLLGSSGGSFGVWVRTTRSGAFVLGSGVTSTVEIVMEGRTAAAGQRHARGRYVERAHLSGADELVVLAPGMLEQLLVLDHAKDATRYVYRVERMPSGARLVSVDGAVLIVDADGVVLVEVTAPWAIDADGEPVNLALRVTGPDRYVLEVDSGQARLPVLVDPVHRLGLGRVTADGETPVYQSWWCGPRSDDSLDFYVASPGGAEDPDTRSLCLDGISGAMRWSANAAPPRENSRSSLWDVEASSRTGIEIGVSRNATRLTPSDVGFVELHAPQYPNEPSVFPTSEPAAGIVGSKFRGTIYDTSGTTACELRYVGNVPNGPMPGFADPSGRQRLWAGHPWGGDDAQHWATFPVPATSPSGGALAPIGNGTDPRTRMVGYFDIMSQANPYQPPAPANQADAIRMLIWPTATLTGRQINTRTMRCGSSGLWYVALNDNDPVRIIDAPDLPEDGWYSPNRVGQIANSEMFRRLQVDDWGSGLRSLRLTTAATYDGPIGSGIRDDHPHDRWRLNPCSDAVEFTDSSDVSSGRIRNRPIFGDAAAANIAPGIMTPCPNRFDGLMEANLGNRDSSLLRAATDRSVGAHYVQLVAEDFVKKQAATPVVPSQRPARQLQGQRGWYWVDNEPPRCGVVSTGIEVRSVDAAGRATVRVHVFDPGWADAQQKGSGVQSLQLVVSGRYGGGALTIDRSVVTDAERTQGYVDLTGVDAWGLASDAGARWVSRALSVSMSATLRDGTQVAESGAQGFVGTCSGSASYPYVDTKAPSCTAMSTGAPENLETAIHVLAGSVSGRIGTVRVFVSDPLDETMPAPQAAGVDSVTLSVNDVGSYTRSLSNDDRTNGYVDIPGVDLLEGVDVPAGATWESFLSQARSTKLSAAVIDRTLLLHTDDAAQHKASCERTIALRLDTTPPSCVDTPISGGGSNAIHVIDPDEDGYATIRVHVTDPGWDSAPPTGAGVGLVRIAVNGQAWIELAATDAERGQGWIEFEDVDVYDGITANRVEIGGEFYFTAATSFRIVAQVEDRTLLFAASEIAQHRDECEVSQTHDQPAVPGLEAVRGADEIQGVWGQVANARGYVWRCERMNPFTELVAPVWFSSREPARLEDVPAGHVNKGSAISAGVYVSTGACAFSPDIGINRELRVHARSERFRILSAERSGMETVDRRPQMGSESTSEITPNGMQFINYWWMSENGVTREAYAGDPSTRDNFVMHVRDTDGDPDGDGLPDDLFSASDPDERILLSELTRPVDPLPAAGDRARIVVTINDDSATEPLRTNVRAYLVVRLHSDPDQVLYRLVEGDHSGVDLATRAMSDADADTCRRGADASNVVVLRYWVLRCDRISASFDTGTGFFAGWTRLEVPIHPREYDEFPLVDPELAPTEGASNTVKPTPDRWSYVTRAAMRARRQSADDQYLSGRSGSGVDSPFSGVFTSFGSNLQDLVIDRVLPTIATQLEQVPDQQHMPVTIGLADPSPSASSDPARLDASGLRDASIQLLDSAGTELDAGVLDSSNCSPAFPISPLTAGDRTGQATCNFTLDAPSAVGTYTVRVRARDMATNVRVQDTTMIIPEAPSVVPVRGAGGVAAWWPAVNGATRYVYQCQVGGAAFGAEQNAIVDSSGAQRSGLCPGPAGERVGVRVTPINAIGLRGPAATTPFERVDARPTVFVLDGLMGTRLSGTGELYESTLNGRVFANGARTPDTVIGLGDVDANLDDVLAPDSHLQSLSERPGCTPCADDRPRVRLTYRPERARSELGNASRRDYPEALHAVVQIGAPAQGGQPARPSVIRLWAGEQDPTAFTRTLDPNDTDTCIVGDAKVLVAAPGQLWTLDCAAAAVSLVSFTHRVRLPIRPVDNGAGADPRFPTPDQKYLLELAARDQRQAADHRYLTARASTPPDAGPDLADWTPGSHGLWLDRVPARLENHQITDDASRHAISVVVRDVLDSSTDPNKYHPSGIRRVHVSGGLVDPATGQVVVSTIDADMSCTPTVPRESDQPFDCAATTGLLPESGLYRYTVTITDLLGNVSEAVIEKSYTAPVPPPPPPASVFVGRGAGGNGAYWSGVMGATSYTWECRNQTLGGALVASGVSVPSPVAGFWRSDLCAGAPGHTLSFAVRSVGPGGASAATTNANTVDQPPAIQAGTDPDGTTTRLDSSNGSTYTNGTTSRDVVIRVTDPNPEFGGGTGTNPHFEGIPQRPPLSEVPGDNFPARSVVGISPPAGRPADSTAKVIIQYHGLASGYRLVKLVGSSFAADPATVALLPGDETSDPTVCRPGQAKTLTTGVWTLNCALINYTATSASDVTVRLPIHPTSSTSDQTYSVSGWVRDQRQGVDWRYLSSGNPGVLDQPHATATLQSLGSIVVDRLHPAGTLQVPATSSNSVQVRVEQARDVVPSGATTPTTFDATGLASARATITRPDGTKLVDNMAMTCSPALPLTGGAATTCTLTAAPNQDGAHEVLVRLTDAAGNHTELTGQFTNTAPASPPGQLDTSFGANGFAVTDVSPQGANVNGSALLANGNIVTVGTAIGATANTEYVALTSHSQQGQRDTSFGTSGIATGLPAGMRSMFGDAVAVDAQGRILVAGYVRTSNFSPRVGVMRFTASGQLDTTFANQGSALITPPINTNIRPSSMLVDQAGRIVVGGFETNTNSLAIVRLLTTGAADTSFDTDGIGMYTPGGIMEQVAGTLALTNDGKLLLAGNLVDSTGRRFAAVARILDTGTTDTSYGSNGWFLGRPENLDGSVRSVIAGPNGEATLAIHCAGGCGVGIARLTPAGVLDPAFGTGGDGATYIATPGLATRDYDIVETSDGRFVAVAQAGTANQNPDQIAIARFNADGLADTTFGSGGVTITPYSSGGAIKTISVVQAANGNAVVAGTLVPSAGTNKFLLAAFIT